MRVIRNQKIIAPMEDLRRSTGNALIAGVASGLARYFNTSPLLFRILFVVTAFWSGTGILIYVILWIGLPSDLVVSREPQSSSATQKQPSHQPANNGNTLATGVLLIILGLMFLLEKWLPDFYFDKVWPVFLILLGIMLLVNSNKPANDQQSSPEQPEENTEGQGSSAASP